jgi:tetratricopeptide (TPR) repeat protein
MIEVRCGNCDQVFEAEETSAGQSEFCPACGALNDVPAPDPDQNEIVPEWEAPPATTAVVAPTRSAGGDILWWVLELAAIGILVWIGWLLFSGSWESRHLQFLSDTSNRADALMTGGDFDGAEREYRRVLNTVGNRNLESLYLRDVVARAWRGVREAQSRKRSSSAASTQAVAATEPAGSDLNQAIKNFQRASEGFPDFVRGRPALFQDIHGSWRRRQFVVWDVTYEIQSDTDPPQISLQYTCNSRLTRPHDDQADALADGQFPLDELAQPVSRKTTYALREGQWVVTRRSDGPEDADASAVIRDGNLRPEDTSVLRGLAALEQRAFGSRTSTRP